MNFFLIVELNLIILYLKQIQLIGAPVACCQNALCFLIEVSLHCNCLNLCELIIELQLNFNYNQGMARLIKV